MGDECEPEKPEFGTCRENCSVSLASRSLRLDARLIRIPVVTVFVGGMISAVKLINRARLDSGNHEPVTVDLHPDRPEYRGFRTPQCIVSLEADPTFEEIEQAGAEVFKEESAHHILGGMFLVSGEIPRETGYELGLQRGMRFDNDAGKWKDDQLIRDERFLVCKIRGILHHHLIPFGLSLTLGR